jgi:hypothetical protein
LLLYEFKNKLAQALVNPNSLFIPLGDIMDMSYYRAMSDLTRKSGSVGKVSKIYIDSSLFTHPKEEL